MIQNHYERSCEVHLSQFLRNLLKLALPYKRTEGNWNKCIYYNRIYKYKIVGLNKLIKVIIKYCTYLI